jgi:hypothetical protein
MRRPSGDQVGQRSRLGSVGVHDEDLVVALAIAVEGDTAAVR